MLAFRTAASAVAEPCVCAVTSLMTGDAHFNDTVTTAADINTSVAC